MCDLLLLQSEKRRSKTREGKSLKCAQFVWVNSVHSEMNQGTYCVNVPYICIVLSYRHLTQWVGGSHWPYWAVNEWYTLRYWSWSVVDKAHIHQLHRIIYYFLIILLDKLEFQALKILEFCETFWKIRTWAYFCAVFLPFLYLWCPLIIVIKLIIIVMYVLFFF